MALRVEDHAMIGHCRTAALVGVDDSIDWLCGPRFDSAACIAVLLGTPENGRWQLAPKEAANSVRRSYRPGTLVLQTEYRTDTGVAAVIDFMPPHDRAAEVIRIVVGQSGCVTFRTELLMRCWPCPKNFVTRLEAASRLRSQLSATR